METKTVTSEDYAALADFLSAFPQETRDAHFWRQRFQHWWTENPAFSEEMQRGWALKDKDQIVGFFGSIPFCFQCEGKPQIAYATTSWRVLPKYRSFSLDLLRQFLRWTQNRLAICATPAEHVAMILKNAGFESIPRDSQKLGRLILNFEKVTTQSLGEKIPLRWIAGTVSAGLEWLQERRLGRLETGGAQVRECSSADESFDELWERTKNQFANTNVRTAKVINWYCFGNPYHRKFLFGNFYRDRLRAYLIFERYQKAGLEILECVDYWGEMDREILRQFVRQVKVFAQTKGADMILFPCILKKHADDLKSAFLVWTKDRGRCELVKYPAGKAAAFKSETTYFNFAQGDIGL